MRLRAPVEIAIAVAVVEVLGVQQPECRAERQATAVPASWPTPRCRSCVPWPRCRCKTRMTTDRPDRAGTMSRLAGPRATCRTATPAPASARPCSLRASRTPRSRGIPARTAAGRPARTAPMLKPPALYPRLTVAYQCAVVAQRPFQRNVAADHRVARIEACAVRVVVRRPNDVSTRRPAVSGERRAPRCHSASP